MKAKIIDFGWVWEGFGRGLGRIWGGKRKKKREKKRVKKERKKEREERRGRLNSQVAGFRATCIRRDFFKALFLN